MKRPDVDPAVRRAQLQIVFSSRRAHLAAELAQPDPPDAAAPRPLAALQTHGYAVAVGLALVAALPAIAVTLFRRRRLLFGVVAAVLRLRRWRGRLDQLQARSRIR